MRVASDLPLRGVKVLDLSRLLPGPYATLVLADLGAKVDKVEDPQGGDYLRQIPPTLKDEGALFLALNRNKRSLALDLKTPEGVAAIKRLVRSYDILLEGFRPGVMKRLGLSFEVLREQNARLIYCSLSGYGQTGPDRFKAGHDLNYIARSGVLGLSGERGGAPAIPGAQIADVSGGLFALVAILAALHERSRTGLGKYLDVSMAEGSMAFIHMHLAARLALGGQGKPLARGAEPLNGGYACYNVYPTSDGRFLSVGALEPKFLVQLCETLGRPELVASAYDLDAEGQRAKAELSRIFAQKPLAHWLGLFADKDLCVEPVQEGDEVLADLQFRARGLFARGHLRTPLRMGTWSPRRAPKLGEHSREILREAGFPSVEIRRLVGHPRWVRLLSEAERPLDFARGERGGPRRVAR